ncbi:MAG TPA: methionine--tRNA ligase [Terriglobia bacterium]|nr:methionine--tRNA ligase [Terriglobia bacterium]
MRQRIFLKGYSGTTVLETLTTESTDTYLMKTFYLTTPIYYPNARPHVGSAYTTIVCDVIARYKRMCGYDVAFLTGTDEHGEKIQRAAEAAGVSPQQFVAEKRKLFLRLWEKLGISVTVYPDGQPDSLRFIYTEHPDHVTSVQRLLKRARANKVDGQEIIYKKRYEGRYCVSDERYVSDNTDPVNCDICGRPAELISEENYFFRLSAFEKQLMDLYEKNPDFVKPDYRMNEVKSFVKSGLRDISISRRRLKWGIPWPDDPEQVFYVWYDALTSYMTGIGYAEGENGSATFKKYWRNTGKVLGARSEVLGEEPRTSHLTPDTSGEIVHMIGKDILRFHAIYWPAFIMAAYPDQPQMLPTTVFAHGWIYYEEDKMSKSKGNVVYPEPIVDALNSFGAPGNDALRYYLLRETTFGQDTSFSYDKLIERYNSDLANGLGNLASRTITLIHRCFDSLIPQPPSQLVDKEVDFLKGQFFGLREYETRATSQGPQSVMIGTSPQLVFYRLGFDSYSPSLAVTVIWVLVSWMNQYLVKREPWKLSESPTDQNLEALRLVLYTAADLLRAVAVLVYPIIPASAERLWMQLGCEECLGKLENQRIDQLQWGDLKPGTKVSKPEPIFPRLDKEKTLAKLHELADADFDRDKPKEATKPVESETPKAPVASSSTGFQPGKEDTAKMAVLRESSMPSAPVDSKISIEDFAKVEMRVGEVLSAEPIPGATKLLKLQVDIGTEVRQVCAGIAEYYQPEQLVGMKVILVTNLQPRKLRGVESNGMILAASVGEQGKPILATFKEDVPKGAKLK